MKRASTLLAILVAGAFTALGLQTWRLLYVQPCPPFGEVPGRYGPETGKFGPENERDRGKVGVVFIGDSITEAWNYTGEFFPGRPRSWRS